MKTVAEIKIMGNSLMAQMKSPINLEDGEYSLEIKKLRKTRSLDQNAYFWALVGEIARHENGDLKDVDNLYTRLLDMAGTKYEVIYGNEEAFESLKNYGVIRHYKIVDRKVIDHQVKATAYVFYGSSQFDSKQMAELIDTTLRYAEEVGVENVNNYWKGVLYE